MEVQMQFPLYTYRPLEDSQWIRVIQLLPAGFHEPLRCNIIHLYLPKLLRSTNRLSNYYHAVSYVWGKPEFSRELICDSNSILRISINVEAMLRYIRKTLSPLNLWVDAVCLNQADKEELQNQVARMGNIYANAMKVRVWLGHNDEGIAKVFAFFRTLAMGEDTIRSLLLEIFETASLEPIDQFLQRPWFSRRWVLQELGLSQEATFYCHAEKITWKLLARALQKLRQKHLDHESRAMDALNTLCTIHRNNDNILELLWNFHMAECFDPRDRLYAIYGLAKNLYFDSSQETQPVKIAEGLVRAFVDYESTFEVIYIRFATACIEAGFAFQILRHVYVFGSLYDRDSNLPSWVPDWSQPRQLKDTSALDNKSKRITQVFNPDTDWSLCSMLSSGGFSAPGVQTWHVEQVCTNWEETWTWDELPQLLLSRYLKSAYTSSERENHLLGGLRGFQSLLRYGLQYMMEQGDLSSELANIIELGNLAVYFDWLEKLLKTPGESMLLRMPHNVAKIITNDILSAARLLIKRHCLFLCRCSILTCVALGPLNTQVRDIFVDIGDNSYFFFRPTKRDQGTYRFMGLHIVRRESWSTTDWGDAGGSFFAQEGRGSLKIA